MAKNAAKRGWCYTLNNYTEDEVKLLQSIDCTYHVIGKEVAPDTGTPHLQGFIYLSHRGRRFGGVKKLPGMTRAHLEEMKGTPAQAKDYCTGMCEKKGFVLNDWVWENGELPQTQGARNDINAIKAMVKAGATYRDVLEVAVNYQSAKHAALLMDHMSEPIERDPNTFRVYWYWGNTGTGKTYTARQEAGPDTWIAGSTLRWWQGYDGHKNVIFDDFRRNVCTFVDLLHYTEHLPWRVEVKGSSRPLRYTRIWITAPHPPEVMWAGRADGEIEQLLDRIHVIREFTGPSKRRQKKLDLLQGVPSESDQKTENPEFPGVPPSVPKVGEVILGSPTPAGNPDRHITTIADFRDDERKDPEIVYATTRRG